MILCETCSYWVKCRLTDKAAVKGAWGFCVREELFTYTQRDKCKDYQKGEPITSEEWEDSQRKF